MLFHASENETERRALRELPLSEFCELVAFRYAAQIARAETKNVRRKLMLSKKERLLRG